MKKQCLMVNHPLNNPSTSLMLSYIYIYTHPNPIHKRRVTVYWFQHFLLVKSVIYSHCSDVKTIHPDCVLLQSTICTHMYPLCIYIYISPLCVYIYITFKTSRRNDESEVIINVPSPHHIPIQVGLHDHHVRQNKKMPWPVQEIGYSLLVGGFNHLEKY